MPLQPPSGILTRTPIYRMVHIECLPTILARGALHAPSCAPNDGLPYVGIHAAQTQIDRGITRVACGPGGRICDYVGFYFGPRSPMLYRISTGYNVARVEQPFIVYLVSTAQAVEQTGLDFVFTDRHSLAAVATFRSRLADLDIVNFPLAYAQQWKNTPDHPDRQEKKQAEFLVHRSMPWKLITGIGVYDQAVRQRVNTILSEYPQQQRPAVSSENSWYY